VKAIRENSFQEWLSFTSVAFESRSELLRLEQMALFQSGLISIHIPAFVEVICEQYFSNCRSLASVPFDRGSKLQGRESDLLVGFAIKIRCFCCIC
jgi:hypothetical protein